jgi:vitamin B12 transporter
VVSADIIVTASALPEQVDQTPAAATVITRQQIEQRQARDVADVLREVPGVAIARTGAPGKSTTIFIRGGSSKQALVLWNGVEMNNPFFSGYNLGQLSVAGVEKVEIVRGPFSALYGSEAVSGVVNVLTTPAASFTSVDLEGGENGLLNAAASGAYTAQNWSVHGGAEHRQDDGFAANDDFGSTTFNAGATVLLRDGLSLGILARHNRYDLGIPFTPNASSDAFVASPDRREEGSESQLIVPVRFDRARFGYELRLSETRRSEDFQDVNGPFGPELSETDARSQGARATARAATAFGTITAGGEYEHAVVDHTSNFSRVDDRDRDSRSFFLEDRLSLSAGSASVEIAAGLRHDHYDTFGSELSPRLAAAWVRNGHKLRAGYGEGFRAPAIGELYSPFFGNAALDPERSRSIEAGYEHFGIRGSLSATFFRSEYENLIAFGPNFTFENIAEASAHGLELAAARRFDALSLGATYTWLHSEDKATGDDLPRRPEHSGSLAIGYDLAPFSAQLIIAHQGQRLDVTDLAPFGLVTNDAYTTADLALHYHRGPAAPYLKIENLTDEQYEEVFGYPSARRRLIIGLRWTTR